MVIWEQDHDVRFLGKIPYRFKWRAAFKDLWNEDEKRLFPPKQFGFGWGLNLYVLAAAYKKIKRTIGKG